MRKLTNMVVFVTIDKKAAQPPPPPLLTFRPFHDREIPHPWRYSTCRRCHVYWRRDLPTSQWHPSTNRPLYILSLSGSTTNPLLPTDHSCSGSSPRDSGRYSWTAFTVRCRSVRADAVDPLALARIG